jgi:hypothetical protein
MSTFITIGAMAVLFLAILAWAPKGWRTALANLVAAVPVVGAEVASQLGGFDWTKVMSPQNAGLAALVVLVMNVVLRAVTTTPIGKSE